MSRANEVEFTLKVMINKQKTKVLFAEVDSNFADVLLSFLTLPLGTIVRILKNHYGDEEAPVFGSLTTLYNGLENLDVSNFWEESGMNMLLYPNSSFEAECRKLKLDIGDPSDIKYFSCQDWDCDSRRSNIWFPARMVTCRCGKMMNREVNMKESDETVGGVFTKNTASFIISDDLRIVPNVAVSVMQTLRNFGITDTNGAELRNVTFGFNEIMDLLKGSLMSQTPLTDLILNKRLKQYETGILFKEKEKEATSNSKKMCLRLMVQKTNNKILFAQAESDFVDFLFSLLAIPLGGVGRLLRGKTCLNNIDNLYKSIVDMDDKYMATTDMRNRIMNPKLPTGYISTHQILPLSEQTVLYYHRDFNQKKEWLSYSGGGGGQISAMGQDSGGENYVKDGLTMYMVSDDLTVTPLCMTSSLSVLNNLSIPLSDVKEVEVHVGLQEALSILKASLTSPFALTDGLMNNPMLKKQPKQEQ